MKHLIYIFFIIISHTIFGYTDTVSNTINQINLSPVNSSSGFSFLVAGHAYGHPSESIYPSQSLINYSDSINSSNAYFLMLLGDNYRLANELNITTFKQSFLNKIKIPVFNAVGNHDIYPSNYTLYKEHFTEKTYYSFIINSSLFIVLDTELEINNGLTNGSITGDQLLFLKETLNQFSEMDSFKTKNIFIFTHKELNLYEDNNYEKEVMPLVNAIATKQCNVYVLSGDMKKSKNELYTIQDKNSYLQYIHTHLSDNKKDKILNIKVSSNGTVHITPVSLIGLDVKEIDLYKYVAPPITQTSPSIFAKIKNRFISRTFYEGMLFLVAILFLFKKWFKRK